MPVNQSFASEVVAKLSSVNAAEAIPNELMRVKRVGKYIPVELGMNLIEGDVVEIYDNYVVSTIVRPNGSKLILSLKDSPFKVEAVSEGEGAIFSRLASAFGLNKWWESDASLTSASATRASADMTRSCGSGDVIIPSDKLEIKNVQGDIDFKVGARERGLFFSWVGGRTPYTLIIKSNGKIVQQVDDINECQVLMPKHDWRAGVYELLFYSAGELAWKDSSLIFVSQDNVPSMPPYVLNEELTPEQQHLLYAAWLLKEHGAEWQIEAVQQVAAYKDDPLIRMWLKQWGGL
jgi:hypothetical protein